MQALYDAFQQLEKEKEDEKKASNIRLSAIQRHMGLNLKGKREPTGFKRMAECRKALEALDRCGWNRSYHQREFHDHFIRACARIFWKTEKPGMFARDHQRILEANGWPNLSQEVLISTPRRFGKTISVSMFAAAMLYSTPQLEMSIYSTCKRISQKLLRNVYKFLSLIYVELRVPKMREIRLNFEEIVLQGGEGDQDVRVVNSYPSKVCFTCVIREETREREKDQAASMRCLAVTVSTLHRFASRPARSKRCSSICSLASWRAWKALASQWRSDLMSLPISRTRRAKVALGKPLMSFFFPVRAISDVQTGVRALVPEWIDSYFLGRLGNRVRIGGARPPELKLHLTQGAHVGESGGAMRDVEGLGDSCPDAVHGDKDAVRVWEG